MRVLVTGASGFLGRHIVASLLSHDCEVIALDRTFDADLVVEWGDKVQRIESDASNLPDIHVDDVVHTAAITASPEEIGMAQEAHLRANVDPALHVLEWARARKSRVMLFSSSAIYGEHASPITEGSSFGLNVSGTYAFAKSILEQMTAIWRQNYRFDVVCVRLSSIYGEGEVRRESRPRVSLVARYIHQALMEGKISVYNTGYTRDWTYAGDIGEAVYWLLHAYEFSSGLYNVASEQVLNSLQIAEAIQAALPDTRIEIMDGDEPNMPLPIQRGYLVNHHFTYEIGFHDWTPFETGIARVIADAQKRLERAS